MKIVLLSGVNVNVDMTYVSNINHCKLLLFVHKEDIVIICKNAFNWHVIFVIVPNF